MNISSLNPLSAPESRQAPSAGLGTRADHSPRPLPGTDPLLGLAKGGEKLARQRAQAVPVSASASTASVRYQQQRDIELELLTREGDRVRVRVFAAESGALSVSQSRVDAGGYSAQRYEQQAQQSSRSSLQFSLEGDLDEEELAAIGDLMAQVNKVADEFFNGDPLKSYQGLQELGFDTAEIAGFSLQLEQRAAVEIRYSEASLQQYRDVAGDQGQRPGLGLGRYIGALGVAFERASILQDASRQLGDLLTQVLRPALEQRQGTDTDDESSGSLLDRARQMNDELLGWLAEGAWPLAGVAATA